MLNFILRDQRDSPNHFDRTIMFIGRKIQPAAYSLIQIISPPLSYPPKADYTY